MIAELLTVLALGAPTAELQGCPVTKPAALHGRYGRGVSLAVSGRRLDAPGKLRVLSVNWGYSSTAKGSWATAVVFPSTGCWRLTGKAGATTLSYVVKVVAA